jgi:hypothetical protein
MMLDFDLTKRKIALFFKSDFSFTLNFGDLHPVNPKLHHG